MKFSFQNNIDAHAVEALSAQTLAPDSNSKAQSQTPFISEAFFKSLQQSQCIAAQSGWQPHYLCASEHSQSGANQKLGADPKWKGGSSDQDSIKQGSHGCELWLPLFIKQHSFAEYVFDWQWADAYQDYHFHYYPKLVSAIPFTPVSGPRWIGNRNHAQHIHQATDAILDYARQENMSSWHHLFCPEDDPLLQRDEFMTRYTIQFQWQNQNYACFDDFLAQLKSKKRKQIRRERKAISHADIRIECKQGPNIEKEDWQFFYQCYQSTYMQRGQSGYLSYSFFELLTQSMPNNLLLMLAYRAQKPIAAALFLQDQQGLFGRYWGATEHHDFLHFELCYYQGIQFAIENKLQYFNPGTQGEHKLSRGFDPIRCYSAHWLNPEPLSHAPLLHPHDPLPQKSQAANFKPIYDAIEHYCTTERQKMMQYYQQCKQHSAYKAVD